DPQQRPSVADVRRAVRQGKAEPSAALVAPAAPAGPAVFVGRMRELEALRDSYRRLRAGRALTVAVHGGSGMGKSALVRRFLDELLVRLADRRPLVLFIDDLQWGDVDSAALLEVLLRPPDPPTLLLIGCYRSEEAYTSPLLKTVLPMRSATGESLEMRDILLPELSASEARQLALELVGGEPGDGRRRA